MFQRASIGSKVILFVTGIALLAITVLTVSGVQDDGSLPFSA